MGFEERYGGYVGELKRGKKKVLVDIRSRFGAFRLGELMGHFQVKFTNTKLTFSVQTIAAVK